MFSEVTGKAEAASFSDEVGYLCACLPHPLPSTPLTLLSHPPRLCQLCHRPQGAQADEVGVHHLPGSKSPLIQPRTRHESNYRTPLGPRPSPSPQRPAQSLPRGTPLCEVSRCLWIKTTPALSFSLTTLAHRAHTGQSGCGGARRRRPHNYSPLETC